MEPENQINFLFTQYFNFKGEVKFISTSSEVRKHTCAGTKDGDQAYLFIFVFFVATGYDLGDPKQCASKRIRIQIPAGNP
jgi:hypothetical protein